MKRFVVMALVVITAPFAACGGDPKPPPNTPDTTVTAASASTSSAPAESKRKAYAKKVADMLINPELTPSPELGARTAAVGFTEQDFGLPAAQLKAFKAIGEQSVDPSQCARILAAMIDETAKPIVDKRCGDAAALMKKIAATAPANKTKEIVTACKITPAMKDVSKLEPMAVLTSAIVGDELAADSQSDDNEKKMAAALVYLCSTAK